MNRNAAAAAPLNENRRTSGALTRITALLLAAFILALDRATKIWAVHRLPLDQQGVTLIPKVLYFTRTSNTGSAFGLFSHSTVLLAAGSLLAALVIAYYIVRQRHLLPVILGIALALPLGGALGNFYDRARHGSVVDFIDMRIGSYAWPVFNVADSAICIGVALLALYSFRTISSEDDAKNDGSSLADEQTLATEPNI